MPLDALGFPAPTKEVAEALERAANLIALPERWTQRIRRRYDPLTDTTSFCAEGALQHVCQSDKLHIYCRRALNQFTLGHYGEILSNFNDRHTHGEVVAVVREAAAAARLRCP